MKLLYSRKYPPISGAKKRSGEDGRGDHQEFLVGAEAEIGSDHRAERAEKGPDHETDVEVEERRCERGPVTGFLKLSDVHF